MSCLRINRNIFILIHNLLIESIDPSIIKEAIESQQDWFIFIDDLFKQDNYDIKKVSQYLSNINNI
jgi:hypothetical protein